MVTMGELDDGREEFDGVSWGEGTHGGCQVAEQSWGRAMDRSRDGAGASTGALGSREALAVPDFSAAMVEFELQLSMRPGSFDGRAERELGGAEGGSLGATQ